MSGRDAIVVGAGHDGITCACELAKAGPSVLVLAQYGRIEGLTRSEELTLPGFRSDLYAYSYQLAHLCPGPRELEPPATNFRGVGQSAQRAVDPARLGRGIPSERVGVGHSPDRRRGGTGRESSRGLESYARA